MRDLNGKNTYLQKNTNIQGKQLKEKKKDNIQPKYK